MEQDVQSAYNAWAESYDAQENKTRDLDKEATKNVLSAIINSSTLVLEFGCGTGKNTVWLAEKACACAGVLYVAVVDAAGYVFHDLIGQPHDVLPGTGTIYHTTGRHGQF